LNFAEICKIADSWDEATIAGWTRRSPSASAARDKSAIAERLKVIAAEAKRARR
jgi:hypothetical protein